ncbi:Pre-rRNA-processing protein ipi3 [Pseudocyphellaria aurata]|nr:Pre-rRNA-processing protein ipi3 [Pseudocyphellaria aurata]
MLTESFLVSTLASGKPNKNAPSKDVGIHLYDLQPMTALKSSYKKSSTQPNCLAASTSHIFAAQAEKAVIHVYGRLRGNQEAVVPFPEKIRSIVLCGDADGGGVLALGTEGGGLILWELCTGRQVSTPPSHLQPTTCLAVDQTSNFLLSGSPDCMIHLWSIPSLLSFLDTSSNDSGQTLPLSPEKSFSNHRAAINALEFGHSSSTANIAVSASQDNTCIVWDYSSGTALHTYLLPTAPLCLAIDPADRAAYVGYEDGGVQALNFYSQNTFTHPLHNPALQSTPTQPPPADRWPSPSPPSPVLSLQVGYDSTSLVSGHANGAIRTWAVGKGRFAAAVADLSAAVTNLKMLPPTGFPTSSAPPLKIHQVIKPRYEGTLGGSNNKPTFGIPPNYTFTAQLASTLSVPNAVPSKFHSALTSPTFPPSLLDASIAELALLPSTTQDDASMSANGSEDLNEQNTHLLAQLNAALHAQRSAMKQVLDMDRERWRRGEAERVKREKKRQRRARRMAEAERQRTEAMKGVGGGGVVAARDTTGAEPEPMNRNENDEVEENDEDEELSSSTDEITDSD